MDPLVSNKLRQRRPACVALGHVPTAAFLARGWGKQCVLATGASPQKQGLQHRALKGHTREDMSLAVVIYIFQDDRDHCVCVLTTHLIQLCGGPRVPSQLCIL